MLPTSSDQEPSDHQDTCFILPSLRLPVTSGILFTCPLSELRSYSVFIGCRSSCLCQYMCWNVERGQSVSQSVNQSVSLSVGVWLLVFCLCQSCNISRPPRCTRTPRLPPASCQFCFPSICVTGRLAGLYLLTVNEDSHSLRLSFLFFSSLVVDVTERCEAPWQRFISFSFLFLIYFLTRLVCVCW